MRSFVAMILVLLALLTAGCAAAIVGGSAVGAIAYVSGEMKSTEKVSFEKAWDASKQTMKDLNFPIVEEKKDGLKGKLLAKRADGSNISIQVEKQPSDLTEMKIRVGAFGDEKESRVILDEIRKRY